jgi:hypothetical protein
MSEKRDEGSTFLSELAKMTPIHGSPSLDEQFKDKGTNNRFNISPVEADRQMRNKLRGR